jgi:hypothetical protein
MPNTTNYKRQLIPEWDGIPLEIPIASVIKISQQAKKITNGGF